MSDYKLNWENKTNFIRASLGFFFIKSIEEETELYAKINDSSKKEFPVIPGSGIGRGGGPNILHDIPQFQSSRDSCSSDYIWEIYGASMNLDDTIAQGNSCTLESAKSEVEAKIEELIRDKKIYRDSMSFYLEEIEELIKKFLAEQGFSPDDRRKLENDDINKITAEIMKIIKPKVGKMIFQQAQKTSNATTNIMAALASNYSS